MTLHIHDTLSRAKVAFEPRDEKNVRLYVCGPTVYDLAHIGNARPVVVFDVLYRLLKRLYPKVTYVRNITDVDDKINAAAKESGLSIGEITARTTKIFHDDMAALGALNPDHEPRATEHIDGMIELVKKLIDSGHAYEAEGNVLFSVPSMANYGKLSKLNRDELIAGARVEVAPYKKDPADFILWKPSTDDLPGWDSPWGRSPQNPKGRGRPGWHLECSVMSEKLLGPEFDIHGGGQDLIFPHHENEIAQSTCMGSSGFAKYWMHNGYLMTEGEKMSKSLGNFYTVHDLLKKFPGEAIRLALLKTHYRQPLDFTKAGILEAKRELDGFYGALRHFSNVQADFEKSDNALVLDALEDDLNTPQAISVLHGFVNNLNFFRDQERIPTKTTPELVKAEILTIGSLLGLLQQDPEDWFKGGASEDDAAIETLITERNEARKNKDFARSDEIRDQLAADGIILEDGAGGTTWKRG